MVTGGAVHTTAVTTAAGLRTANVNTKAKKIRNARGVRGVLPSAPVRSLLVWKIFKFWSQLTNPPAVVEAADEMGVSLVASHIEELFPGDDLSPCADDVRDPISPDADYVPAASHGRSLEVSRPCVHCQAHYSK